MKTLTLSDEDARYVAERIDSLVIDDNDDRMRTLQRQLVARQTIDDSLHGVHLGTVRKWMQWHARNGSEVTWGSEELLQMSATVGDMERLAQAIADAVCRAIERSSKLS